MQKFNFNKVTSGLIVTFLLVSIISFTGQVNAQAPPNMPNIPNMPKMITGQYSNSDYGVQMTFPDGWTAMEIKSDKGDSVIAQPANSAGSSSTPIMIMLSMTPIPATTTAPPVNPNVPTDPQVKCNTISSDGTTINSMSAQVTVMQCSGPNVDMKMKGDSFKTDKNYIFASLIATPSSSYDSNVATFDSAVNTLQIANTVGAPSAPQSASTTTIQNSTSGATTPEFPTVASLILAVSVFVIIGFTMISRKSGLSSFGRN